MSTAGQLRVTVLGTGTSQGIPVIGCNCPVCQSPAPEDKRLRTAIAVQWRDLRLVVDIGPDFRQQMLRHHIDDVDAVLLTHEHNDHVNGLDEIRPINFLRRKNVPIYAQKRVLGEVRKRFPYVFDSASQYPGRPRVEMHEIDKTPFALGDCLIRPVQVMHGSLPILGFRFGDFCYITDMKTIAEEEMQKLHKLEVLILNALHRKPHFSHLNLDEALAMVERIKPGKAFLTHISHYMGRHDEVEAGLPANVHLAYDGMTLSL